MAQTLTLAQAASTAAATKVSCLPLSLLAALLQWALEAMSWEVVGEIQGFFGAVFVTGATACIMVLTQLLMRTR